MTDWREVARRVVFWTAVLTGVLMLLGMVLSYAGMRSFFTACGFPGWAALLAPLVVDLLAAVGYVGLIVLPRKAYPAAVVALGVVGSAAAQGYHLSHGGVSADVTDPWVIAAAGAAPMVSAGLAAHLLKLILDRVLPADFLTALRGEELPAAVVPAAAPVGRYEDGGQARLDTALTRFGLPPAPAWTPPAVLPPRVPAIPAELPPTAPRITAQVSEPKPKPKRAQRPPAGGSQLPGPCEGCKHHVGDVSKSARYRCQGGTCGTCKKLEEIDV